MARKKPTRIDGRTPRGTFAPGISGNPSGLPKVERLDAKPTAAVPARRWDGWSNFFTGHGVLGRDKRMGTSFQVDVLTFDQMTELARGDDLAKRACETFPREAFRQGWDLVIAAEEGDEDEEERVTEILDKLDLLGAKTYLKQALAYERYYGGSAILLGVNDGQKDLSKPLNLDKVKSIDWLTPLEARELMPVYGYVDPFSPKYGQPEIYRLSSRAVLASRDGSWAGPSVDIHESRLLIFPGNRVSRYQVTAMQGGWGDSVLTPMWRVLRDFNLTWASAGAIVADFAQAVYKMKDLWETLASDDAGAFQARIASMELTRSTINATVIDSEDDFSRQSTSLAGLPDLLDKFATRLAAAADMPLTLLFGTSPAGMNATGESDIRFFYDRVAEYQEERVLPQLKKLIQIVMRCTGVKQEPKKWSVTFRPLWQESAGDKATAMSTQATADSTWIAAGVLSAEEVAAAHWQSGKYNPDITVDFAARERQEQAVKSPINQEDLNALDPNHPDYKASQLDPNHPEYIPPPSNPDEPDPNTPPKNNFKTEDAYRSRKWRAGTKYGPRNPPGKLNGRNVQRKQLPPAGDKAAERPDPGLRSDWSPDQARDERGRWAGGDAPALMEHANATGGFTYNPRTGEQPTAGYSVAVHGERELKLQGKAAIDPTKIANYIKDNHDVLLRDPQAHVGSWYNAEKDTWVLDIPHVERDLAVAAKLGHDHQQDAIYDLKRGESIYAHEYPEAIAKTGRFAGRTDALRPRQPSAGSDLRPADHHARGDGRGDEEASRRGPEGPRPGRVDWSPDQARDERGRWSAEGGSGEGVGDRAALAAFDKKIGQLDWRGGAGGFKNTQAAFKKDGKYPPDRQALHDTYVHDVLADVPSSHNVTVYMTGGGPASGKTTGLLKNPAAGIPPREAGKTVYVSADHAKEYLPEFGAGKAAGDQDAAGFVHEESADMTKSAIHDALRAGKDITYDSTGDSGIDKLEQKVRALRDQGASRVVASYAIVDPGEAYRRSVERAKDPTSESYGRFVHKDVLYAAHADVAKTVVGAMKRGIYDDLKVFDTNKRTPVLIAESSKAEGLRVHDPEAWAKVVARAEGQ